MIRPLLLAVTLALLGCASGPAARPENAPRLEQLELKVGQTLTTFTLRADGVVACPEPATLERATFELVVDGKVLRSGEVRLSISLPPSASAPFTFEQSGAYAADAKALEALSARGGTVLAALRGKLFVRRGSAVDEVPYARSREVRVPRLPVVKVHDLDAARYAKDEANGTLYLGVQNPNPFPLSVKGLRYRLTLAGRPAGEGELAKADQIDAAATGVYEVPLAVTRATHGPEVEKLIQGLALPYVVEGELDHGRAALPYRLEGKIQLNPSKR